MRANQVPFPRKTCTSTVPRLRLTVRAGGLDVDIWFIQYRYNLITELLFWRVLIGLFLVVSLFTHL